MKASGLALALAAALAIGQAQTVSIRPHTAASDAVVNGGRPAPSQPEEKRGVRTGVAILGYIGGPEAAQLHAIVGSSESPKLGDQIALPTDTRRIYLPPRQHYALLAQTDQPVSVWNLHRAASTGIEEHSKPIAGAITNPDLVAFSPRGEAVLLYSQASSSVQVVHNVPAQNSIARQLSVQGLGEISSVAVTDDAALVIAVFTDGRLMTSSPDGLWRSLAIGFTPVAWSFLPNTHDLVISDPTQEEVILLSKLDETLPAVRILAQGVQADRLAVTKDAEHLIAASTTQSKLWAVELKTGAVTSLRSKFPSIDSLILLRDGRTFLVWSSALSALNPGEFADRMVPLPDTNVADQAQGPQSEQ